MVTNTFRDCLRRKHFVPKKRAGTPTLHILTSKTSKDRLNLMQQNRKHQCTQLVCWVI